MSPTDRVHTALQDHAVALPPTGAGSDDSPFDWLLVVPESTPSERVDGLGQNA